MRVSAMAIASSAVSLDVLRVPGPRARIPFLTGGAAGVLPGTAKPLASLSPEARVVKRLNASWRSRSVQAAAENVSPQKQAFSQLKLYLQDMSSLAGVRGLLAWDTQTSLPKNAHEARGHQSKVLARLAYDMATSHQLKSLLDAVGSDEHELAQQGLEPEEVACVREALKSYQQMVKMPAALQERAAQLEVKSNMAWMKAREAKDWSLFAPCVQEWVDLRKEMAAAQEPGWLPYDWCLEQFETGLRSDKVAAVFGKLKGELLALHAAILKQGKVVDRSFLMTSDLFCGLYSLETQKRISRRLAHEIGFRSDSGQQALSVHPFTMGVSSPVDVRFTVSFDETDLTDGVRGTLHEAGHALYEQGLNAKYAGLPVARPRSMGLHESQSLFWERMVGMSAPYWKHYWPAFLGSFSSLPPSTYDKFYAVINEVKPSLIRVQADEVSYPLHVILRWELEEALFQGRLGVMDVPRVWNQKCREYLGVEPRDDLEGCLQDIHWSMGLFGYFPTYTIGAVYAAQLYKEMLADLPDVEDEISQGQFFTVRRWLEAKVHKVGCLHADAEQTMMTIVGEGLNPDAFLKYLKAKYAALYDLKPEQVKVAN